MAVANPVNVSELLQQLYLETDRIWITPFHRDNLEDVQTIALGYAVEFNAVIHPDRMVFSTIKGDITKSGTAVFCILTSVTKVLRSIRLVYPTYVYSDNIFYLTGLEVGEEDNLDREYMQSSNIPDRWQHISTPPQSQITRNPLCPYCGQRQRSVYYPETCGRCGGRYD